MEPNTPENCAAAGVGVGVLRWSLTGSTQRKTWTRVKMEKRGILTDKTEPSHRNPNKPQNHLRLQSHVPTPSHSLLNTPLWGHCSLNRFVNATSTLRVRILHALIDSLGSPLETRLDEKGRPVLGRVLVGFVVLQ